MNSLPLSALWSFATQVVLFDVGVLVKGGDVLMLLEPVGSFFFIAIYAHGNLRKRCDHLQALGKTF